MEHGAHGNRTPGVSRRQDTEVKEIVRCSMSAHASSAGVQASQVREQTRRNAVQGKEPAGVSSAAVASACRLACSSGQPQRLPSPGGLPAASFR
jgi:hypothetical protein